jgi:hypothetical protein
MHFHPFVSTFESMKGLLPSVFSAYKPDEYYQEMMTSLIQQGKVADILGIPPDLTLDRNNTFTNQTHSEWDWYKAGKPYINIHPKLIPTFSRCPLTVPAKLIKFPDAVNAFAMQFPSPQDGNTLVIDTDHWVRAILVHRADPAVYDKLSKRLGMAVNRGDEETRVVMWVDIGEKHPSGVVAGKFEPIYFYKVFVYSADESIDEALRKLPDDANINEGVRIPTDLIDRRVRLVASVCFLAADPDGGIVVPDVLNRDKDKLYNATPEVIQTLHQRAKRNGKYGWLMGTDELFAAPKSTGDGQELKWSHLRQGHFHTVRHGPGKSLQKVVWYSMTRVRPDLPMKPEV